MALGAWRSSLFIVILVIVEVLAAHIMYMGKGARPDRRFGDADGDTKADELLPFGDRVQRELVAWRNFPDAGDPASVAGDGGLACADAAQRDTDVVAGGKNDQVGEILH